MRHLIPIAWGVALGLAIIAALSLIAEAAAADPPLEPTEGPGGPTGLCGVGYEGVAFAYRVPGIAVD